MISQPLLTIDKFSGMSDDGGTYYIDGFNVVKENGLTSLDQCFTISERYNADTANFSLLGNVMAMASISKLSGSTQSEENSIIAIDSNSKLFISGRYGFETDYSGYITGNSTSGTYLSSQKPDLIRLPSGNIIYSSAHHISLGIIGKVKAGSSTTKIIDNDGRNFSTLGITTTEPNNTVTNIKTGKQYTIKTISTTNQTNDTLEFDAIGTSPNTTNDQFIATVITKWDMDYINGASGTRVTTFPGQQGQAYAGRYIRQFGIGDVAKFAVLNGNNIGMISDETTEPDFGYKPLPLGYQAVAFDINAGYYLVSAYDMSGAGHLLYWDGFSDGWNNDMPVDKAPRAIKNYVDGWVYMVNGEIFYTNGTQINSLIKHPDSTFMNYICDVASGNGIAVLNDKIYFAVSSGNLNRLYQGILVFDRKNGLFWAKNKLGTVGFNSPYCVYNIPFTTISQIFQTSNSIIAGCQYSLNELKDYNYSDTATTDYKSFVMLLDFKQATQVSQIWLNLKHTSKYYSKPKNKVCDITVSVGNGRKGIISYGQVGEITAVDTLPNTNGEYYPGEVGDEIEFTNGGLAGQRTFITAITGNGNNEVWTVSPSVSATYASSSDIRTWHVKKAEQKTVSIDNIDQPVIFNCNFFGSKMYIEVVVRGNANSFPLSINDIQLF